MDTKRITAKIEALIPERVFTILVNLFWREGLVYRALQEIVSYARHSRTFTRASKSNIEAELVENYHAIEKGLSFKKTRKGFGAERIKKILKLLKEYTRSGYDTKSVFYQSAIDSLQAYVNWHEAQGEDVEWVKKELQPFQAQEQLLGGTIHLTAAAVQEASRGNFEELTHARHSVRNFTDEPVDPAVIREAVTIAQQSPSACNRQPARVYVVDSQVTDVLAIQSGNTGFREYVDKVLVVTATMSGARGASEMHLPFVDGGLFAMSLVYALQYKGIGTCMLNWYSSLKNDRKLRKIVGIPDDERVVVFIAIGTMPEELDVAQSTRQPVDEVIHFV